jgi:transcriptional regulator with XRE-family HTH domain
MNAIRDLRQRRGLTQTRLAEFAHTSQPTIAAYEAGTKSPNLRTLERLARSVGLEAVVEYVPPLTREDRRSLALHRAIARRLEEEPERTLRHAREATCGLSEPLCSLRTALVPLLGRDLRGDLRGPLVPLLGWDLRGRWFPTAAS